MLFLTACNKNGELIILYVEGFSKDQAFGMTNQEGIFEVKSINDTSTQKQIGIVQINENHLSFNYTDDDFKKSIGYCEKTGSSSMDGGLWEVRNKTIHEIKPTLLMSFVYSSAYNPFMRLPNLSTLFAASNINTKTNAMKDELQIKNQM
jgi:hypothetical protein